MITFEPLTELRCRCPRKCKAGSFPSCARTPRPDVAGHKVPQLLSRQDFEDEVAGWGGGAGLRLDPRQELAENSRRPEREGPSCLEMVSGASVGHSLGAEWRIATVGGLARRQGRELR